MINSLVISEVHKSYGSHQALKGVSLSVEAGERWLLTGPSGSGKTTLLRLIAGFEAPNRGDIRITGSVVSGSGHIVVPPCERGIGMLFQDLGLWPHLSASETLALALEKHKLERRERRVRIAEILVHVGLGGQERKKPGAFSGGEQQRLALARALIGQPKILLLDEPFSSVDLKTRLALCDLVIRESKSRGTTVIMAGHDLLDALRMDAKLAILEEGLIRQTGHIHDILANPTCDTAQLWAKVAHTSQSSAKEV